MTCSVCHRPLAEPVPHRSGPIGHECPFCAAVFSRVDGARRHAKSCPQRGDRPLRAGKRGRRTKSCDQCSRVKVHCNARGQDAPCERCVSRGLDCTFRRCCTDATHWRPRRPSTHRDDEDDELQDSQRGHGRGCVPLSFLLNVTDEKQDFITERQVGEEPDSALLGPTCGTPPQAQAPSDESLIAGYMDPNYIDPTLLLPSDPLVLLELGGLYNTEEQNLLGAFLSPPSQEDRLSVRLDLLELQVAAHATCSSRNGLEQGTSFDATAFRRFFSVSNVQEFAKIFCRKRHYWNPVIHWTTFALEEALLPLLMVVALTGATYSYRPGHGPEHVTNARKLCHLADSYVFHHLSTYLDRLSLGTIDLVEAIQLGQAALLMYTLDLHLAGDSAMQRMAVTKRLPALVSAMRRLHFIGCRHDPSEDRQLFLQREHIIRLVTWTFCADCLATLSFNHPPIFSVLEMSGHLPCDAALWDSDPASDFDFVRCSIQGNSHCLNDLMSRLLDDDFRVDDDWENLPLFHLHVILCAIQPIIFNLHVAMSLVPRSTKLLQTLSTWRHLWETAVERIPSDRRKFLGVARNVLDIEYLSRRIIKVAVSPEAGSSRYLRRIPSCSARELHVFIRDFISKHNHPLFRYV